MHAQPGKTYSQGRDVKRYPLILGIILTLALFLSGCNLPVAIPADVPVGTPSGGAAPIASSTPASSATPISGMQIRFVNLTDGGTVAGTFDENGKPLVRVQVEVSGLVPLFVNLTVNGLPAVDEGGHTLEAANASGASPFTGEIPWSPANGGGEYTLVAGALDSNKQYFEATVHVTVTGIPVFTPTPPPPDMAGAQQQISELIRQEFGVSIPKPSVYRFDAPRQPNISRWIGSAYYNGTRYYIDLYDDTHYAWSNAEYSDLAHRVSVDKWVLCRPSGSFRVLTVFVDYGNTGAKRDEVLSKVPPVVSWLNGLYSGFASSQGLSAPLMRVEADAAYVSPPPTPGEFITADQLRSLTGMDASAYDFIMQIDLDANATLAQRYYSDILTPGGGVALNGCATGNKSGIINIWSSVTAATNVEGGLVMDFNHELSHLFGMTDNWPFIQGAAGPDGMMVDDWIPYDLFGWTDTDGDGIPEIIDPTPYGTTGP
jgi:hypothetical protein